MPSEMRIRRNIVEEKLFHGHGWGCHGYKRRIVLSCGHVIWQPFSQRIADDYRRRCLQCEFEAAQRCKEKG